jgi:BexC/CtrB/KpsE family polysaccharide export inner-membrane protein
MSESKLNYLGPTPKLLPHAATHTDWRKRLPIGFLIVVLAPTLLAAIYFFLIATPRYVSEARFIVRAPSQPMPSGLGAALSSVGISAGPTDAFAVHEYINSRDGVAELSRRNDLRAIFGARGADLFSRYPRPWEDRTEEGLYTAFRRFVKVGYDSQTGISTLTVETFNPQDSKRLSEALLGSGERLVNRLNERASSDAVTNALRAQADARSKLTTAQQALTAFRNKQQYIDPTRAATESSSLVVSLLETLANLQAERSQLSSQAPQSPQLSALDSRIAAYERQVATERAKIAGTSGSLASQVGAYEDLTMAREFADRELTQATSSLVAAEQDVRRQRLYLDRVVNPSLPDRPGEPNRLLAVLTVLLSTLMLYGVGWLIWAGVREHGQD